jgi:hypothetical protein
MLWITEVDTHSLSIARKKQSADLTAEAELRNAGSGTLDARLLVLK